ncbi:MupA/Atu3671 family FMN-dependent luciferase-like monooxygenase [uncultured Sphingomonas sp.]|uniref:MupA/Atu3671 family FMN-dependent luciferase-like monooxygenase n=1 Tax=uncultured Sphingomonas sp. TaxID=158754 RepID=UPI0026010813|nr:MupA/Atu3671 family FMN-dependent luciferase-like monooxygenase [uncultured Sphingomonas sp.]
MDFSIMFFSGGESQSGDAGRYDVICEAARRADAADLRRIWLPERHFVHFGALHPNPAVLAAHLAAQTQHIRLAAGSVVAPLHDPIRIVEEWAVVDNLSGGRVDIALASGWLESDFALAPDLYTHRHRELRKRAFEVRDLWNGASVTRTVAGKEHRIAVRPRPVQPQPGLWITAARSTETFRYAGSIGANVLTYLVDLGLEGLAAAIAAYREARIENGFSAEEGVVSVMVHSFLGTHSGEVRDAVARPYRDYLVRNSALLLQSGHAGQGLDAKTIDEIADIQFERVFEKLSLIGSFEAAHRTLHALTEIGVDEVACLVDFVDEAAQVLQSVDDVAALARQHAARDASRARPVTVAAATADLVADRARFYDYIGTLGGFYGDEFRLIDQVVLHGNEAETTLSVDDTTETAKAILVDAIISTAHAFALRPGMRGSSIPLAMPAGVGAMTIGDVRAGTLTVTTRAKGRREDLEFFDAVARDAEGTVVAEFTDIAFNRLRLASNDPRMLAAGSVLHEGTWRPAPSTGSAAGAAKLVVEAWGADLADAWVTALSEAGAAVSPNPDMEAREADACHLLVIGEVAAQSDALEAAQAITLRIADWVRALQRRNRDARWIVLLQGAQAVAEGDPLPDPVAAAAWAASGALVPFGAAGRCGMIDVARVDAATARCICAALEGGTVPAAVRDGRLFTLHMVPAAPASSASFRSFAELESSKGALVLGGNGALGQMLTEWLGEEGVAPLATVSRTLPPGAPAGIQRTPLLRCRGDIATQTISEILAGEDLKATDFSTIFHLAGVDLPETDGVTSDVVRAVFAPKIGGVRQLSQLLADSSAPRHVIFFSSLAALRGSQGQVAYSAANSAAAAALRRLVAGTPHRLTLVHFGPWAGAGMAASPHLDAILAMKGVERLAPEIALRALGLALAAGRDEIVIAEFTAAPSDTTEAVPSADTILILPPSTDRDTQALRALRDRDPDEQRRYLIEQLRTTVAEALECEVAEVDAGANLYDLGFDSLMAVELRNTLAEEYGIEVGLVVLMDARTISDVVERLMPLVTAALERSGSAPLEEVREKELIL